jgi:hypothetical protein
MTLDEVFEDLILIVSEVGAQVYVPAESERFFTEMVEQFDGSRQDLLDHVSSSVGTWFKCFRTRPEWIQEAEWQFHDGRPMMFVGQISVPAGRSGFHDDAAFYLFYDPETGVTKNVIQVA